MKKIGLIGLGAMGFPIAKRLQENGFELCTYVRSKHSLRKAEHLNIQVVDTPASLSKYTNTVILLVNNYSQCHHCLYSVDGILSSLMCGTVIISSTIGPKQIKELSSLCPPGVEILDAPISGGVIGAETGTLVTMVAGKKERFVSVKNIFASYSKKIVYVGEVVGQAQALKAINQMLVGIHMVATAESYALSQELGIDPQAMFETISECAGNSNIFHSRIPKLIAEDYSAHASLQTLEKDTGICKALADMKHIPCYLTTLCHDLFQQTPSSDPSGEDACAVIRLYKKEK